MRTRPMFTRLVALSVLLTPSLALAAYGVKPKRPVSGDEWNQPKESRQVHRARQDAAETYVEGLRVVEEARGEMFRIQQLRAMSARDPESGEKARHLAASAQVHLQQGKRKFLRVTTLDPQNADGWNMLGYTRLRTGDTEGAFKAIEKALALKPDHIGAHENIAEGYLERGRIQEARAELDWLKKRGNMATLETNNLESAINLWTAGKQEADPRENSGKE